MRAVPMPVIVLAAVIHLGLQPARPANAPPITGLDHIPIAVNDLEQASAHYRALGFALKPGRPHANGIRNQHVKFPDGTELELITAPEARDALTTKYRNQLAKGDGPAFLALYTESPAQVAEHLTALDIAHRTSGATVDVDDGNPLDYMFFGPRNKSPTDRPEHFAHANTADSLIGVWLSVGDRSAEERMLERLGVTLRDEERDAPGTYLKIRVAPLPEGEILLMQQAAAPERRIVGATVRVRDLAAARRIVERDPRVRDVLVAKRGASSIFLPPSVTHGLWLELRQVAR
jgi:catechol 2,3-dioxygenase-like lactoylglutathione lyase family enzyme